MTRYLEISEILEVHEKSIESHGGTHGLRDEGALESACMRPQTGYYTDTIAEAAALMESLAGNHPFIDGNKRTAVASTDAFLRLNGHRIRAESMDLYGDIIGMFEKKVFSFENIEAMLRRVVRKDSGDES